MSGRGYRGGRGGGVGPPRGRGSRKRPLTNSYDDSGPPAVSLRQNLKIDGFAKNVSIGGWCFFLQLKTNRGPGAPRQTERSGNWPRVSDQICFLSPI
jgi:hypothetical protein